MNLIKDKGTKGCYIVFMKHSVHYTMKKVISCQNSDERKPECFFKKAFAPMWKLIVSCLCVSKSITSFNFEKVKCQIPTKIAQKLSCLISYDIELPKEPS
jgi:hypothetical protein